MKLAEQQPFTITECRSSEFEQRPFLELRVKGPKSLFFREECGHLMFYYEGYRWQTTQGKGATRLEFIDHMNMIEHDGRFELQAEMKLKEETGLDTSLRRIAATDSQEVAVTIWRSLAEIGFPLGRGPDT